MEVTFTLTPQDLWEFNRFVIRRDRGFQLRLAVRYAFGPVCLAALAVMVGLSAWQCVLIGGVFAVVWVPVCQWSARAGLSRAARRQFGLLEEQTLRVSGEGLRQINAQVNALVQWTALPEIGESATQILLFRDRHYAFIVPKRAFGSLAQGEAYLDRARRCWSAAKTGQLLPDDAPAEEAGVWPPPPRPAIQERV